MADTQLRSIDIGGADAGISRSMWLNPSESGRCAESVRLSSSSCDAAGNSPS